MRLAAMVALCVLLASVVGCGLFFRPDVEPEQASLGRLAPTFALADTDGVQRSLPALTAQGAVVLYFFCDT